MLIDTLINHIDDHTFRTLSIYILTLTVLVMAQLRVYYRLFILKSSLGMIVVKVDIFSFPLLV